MEKEKDEGLQRKLAELEPYWRGGVALFVPIFGHHVRLLVGSDEDAIEMVKNASANMVKMAQPSKSSMQAEVSGLTRTIGAESVIIMRRLWLESDIDKSVLYHESLHVAIKILEQKGIVPDAKGEMTAWLQQYIGLGLISRMLGGEFFTIKPDGSKSQPLNRPIISQCSLAEHESYTGR